MRKLTLVALLLFSNFANAGSTTLKQIDNIQNSTGGSSIVVPSVGGTFATDTNTLTLTGKTISGASNTISSLSAASITSGQLAVANGGTGTGTGSYTGNGVVYLNGAVFGSTAQGNQYQVLTVNGSNQPFMGAVNLSQGGTAVTGTLQVNSGGSGALTFTTHGVLFGEGTTAFGVSTAGTSGQALISGGAGADPAFGALNISTAAVTGTLAVGNGGTGVVNPTSGSVYIGAGSSPMTAVAPGTSGNVLTSNGSSWVSSAAAGGSPSLNGGSGTPLTVTAAGGVNITSIGYSNMAWVVGSPGAVIVTKTPSLTVGTADGQKLNVIGTDAAKTVTLQDKASLASSGLSLNGNWTGGKDAALNLHWDATQSLWVEDSRSN